MVTIICHLKIKALETLSFFLAQLLLLYRSMKTRNSRFQRGSGTYRCSECDKLTRETGYGESGCGLCVDCYNAAGEENESNDYGHPLKCEYPHIHDHSKWLEIEAKIKADKELR
jgi:hypothetical protein